MVDGLSIPLGFDNLEKGENKPGMSLDMEEDIEPPL